MYKINRFLYIHIWLIYFTFTYSPGVVPSGGQARASQLDPTSSLDELSEEKVKAIKKQYMEFAKERLFDFRGKPSGTDNESPSTRLSVPSAILKEYIKFREEVREVVPDDRDFYGKIKLEDLDKPRSENIWSGDQAIEVDMGSSSVDEREVDTGGSDDRIGGVHIAIIPLSREPKDVPPNVEAILPPHTQNPRNQQKFSSVHLHYNLSQEVYTDPSAADNFKKAYLRLTREKVSDCDDKICLRKPIPFFSREQTSVINNRDHLSQVHNIPRFQRIYVLQVLGYDQFGDPITASISSQRIDTQQETLIEINISPIVKTWLMDPSSNFGIIVRVRNDNDPYGKDRRTKAHSQTIKREIRGNHTNASNEPKSIPEDDVLEHVRLKRAFKSSSDNTEIWREKQPSIMIWLKTTPLEQGRKHVKRHQGEDNIQADEPDSKTHDYHQIPTTTALGNFQTGELSTLPTSTDKSTLAATSGPVGKRDQAHIGVNARRPNQAGRASSSGRPVGQQSARPKGKHRQPQKQTENKCQKRSLNINFDEVGWSSWIIAPQAYNAFFCSGDCNWPLSDQQNSTNHAIIQAIYRSVGRLVPKSCCAPVKLGRMAILYQLDGIVQMRQYDDMIVEACGCL